MSQVRKFWLSLVSCLCWTPSVLAYNYTVQEGDTLSQIAFCLVSKKVYGKLGSLQQITKLNPRLADLNSIKPGEEIILPGELPPSEPTPSESREIATDPITVKQENSTPEQTNPFARYSFIKITPTFSYARWDGADPRDGSKAALISKTNVGADISWNQVWSEHWRSFESFGLNRWEVSPDTSTHVSIENRVQVAPKIGMGVIYIPVSGLEVGGSFFYTQQLYYHGVNGTQALVLDGVMVPAMELWANQRLLMLNPFDLVVEGKMTSLLPASTANYNTSFGLGYQAKVEVGQTFESSRFSVGWTYRFQSQNSSILSLSRKEMGLELGWTWRLGQ